MDQHESTSSEHIPDAGTPETLGIKDVVSQLIDDSRKFAEAEFTYLKANVGERASYAIPALVMLGLATALSAGAVIALIVGLMFLLEPVMTLFGAIVFVTVLSGVIAWLLFRAGSNRLKNTLKPRGER
jgi:uncharacterized membrane protein